MGNIILSILKGIFSIVGLFMSGMLLQKQRMEKDSLTKQVDSLKKSKDVKEKVKSIKDEDELDRLLNPYYRD